MNKISYQARHARLLERMQEEKIDALLINKAANQHYFEGFRGNDCFLLITAAGSFLFADSRYVEQGEKECAVAQVLPYKGGLASFAKSLASVCATHSVRHLAFEGHSMLYDLYQTISEELKGVAFCPTRDFCEGVRMIKTDEEVDCIHHACKIADRALQLLLPKIRPGVSERQLASELEYLMALEGAEGVAFDTIVAFGAHSSQPHAIPRTDVLLQTGDLILIDYGCRYQGYHSDSTRTLVCGSATRQQKHLYALTLEAHKQAVAALKPGWRGDSAEYAASAVLNGEGYLEGSGAYQHALGHGVGLEIHEQPVIRAGTPTLLEEGFVLTIEPGLYLPDWGGIRIEDTLHIGETGACSLVEFPKDTLLEVGE